MAGVKKVEAPKPYVWSKWPTHAVNSEGVKKVCHNPDEYERHTGVRVDESGNPVDVEPPRSMPPTLEVVIKAGYAERVAIDIVAEEWRKCSEGEAPYEWNAPPPKPQSILPPYDASLGQPSGEPAKEEKPEPIQSGQAPEEKPESKPEEKDEEKAW